MEISGAARLGVEAGDMAAIGLATGLPRGQLLEADHVADHRGGIRRLSLET